MKRDSEMTCERLRELEWAATYLKITGYPPVCRCSWSCDRCKPYHDAARKITPQAVLELVAEVRAWAKGAGWDMS